MFPCFNNFTTSDVYEAIILDAIASHGSVPVINGNTVTFTNPLYSDEPIVWDRTLKVDDLDHERYCQVIASLVEGQNTRRRAIDVAIETYNRFAVDWGQELGSRLMLCHILYPALTVDAGTGKASTTYESVDLMGDEYRLAMLNANEVDRGFFSVAMCATYPEYFVALPGILNATTAYRLEGDVQQHIAGKPEQYVHLVNLTK